MGLLSGKKPNIDEPSLFEHPVSKQEIYVKGTEKEIGDLAVLSLDSYDVVNKLFSSHILDIEAIGSSRAKMLNLLSELEKTARKQGAENMFISGRSIINEDLQAKLKRMDGKTYRGFTITYAEQITDGQLFGEVFITKKL